MTAVVTVEAPLPLPVPEAVGLYVMVLGGASPAGNALAGAATDPAVLLGAPGHILLDRRLVVLPLGRFAAGFIPLTGILL